MLGRLARAQVVTSGVDQDGLRLVGQYDAINKVIYLAQSGAAETTVDDRVLWEMVVNISPAPRVRSADQQHGILGWRHCDIACLECLDRLFPSSEFFSPS